MSQIKEGLTHILETINAFSFDGSTLLFEGIHPSSLILMKQSLKWSELDCFTPVNIEKNFFKYYSDVYMFSSKFSLMEREIYKGLGFDFDKVDSICESYVRYMHDFNMHKFDYLYVKAIFKEKFANKYDSFGGIASDCNYYSKEFSGGLNLNAARIFIQLFLHYQDGVIHPRAKITFPLSEEGYFSVIIGSEELYETALSVVKDGVHSEFKALLIDTYPDECFDAVEFNEETLKQYLTVINMEKI